MGECVNGCGRLGGETKTGECRHCAELNRATRAELEAALARCAHDDPRSDAEECGKTAWPPPRSTRDDLVIDFDNIVETIESMEDEYIERGHVSAPLDDIEAAGMQWRDVDVTPELVASLAHVLESNPTAARAADVAAAAAVLHGSLQRQG